jgi:hypothetical protein
MCFPVWDCLCFVSINPCISVKKVWIVPMCMAEHIRLSVFCFKEYIYIYMYICECVYVYTYKNLHVLWNFLTYVCGRMYMHIRGTSVCIYYSSIFSLVIRVLSEHIDVRMYSARVSAHERMFFPCNQSTQWTHTCTYVQCTCKCAWAYAFLL